MLTSVMQLQSKIVPGDCMPKTKKFSEPDLIVQILIKYYLVELLFY